MCDLDESISYVVAKIFVAYRAFGHSIAQFSLSYPDKKRSAKTAFRV